MGSNTASEDIQACVLKRNVLFTESGQSCTQGEVKSGLFICLLSIYPRRTQVLPLVITNLNLQLLLIIMTALTRVGLYIDLVSFSGKTNRINHHVDYF